MERMKRLRTCRWLGHGPKPGLYWTCLPFAQVRISCTIHDTDFYLYRRQQYTTHGPSRTFHHVDCISFSHLSWGPSRSSGPPCRWKLVGSVCRSVRRSVWAFWASAASVCFKRWERRSSPASPASPALDESSCPRSLWAWDLEAKGPKGPQLKREFLRRWVVEPPSGLEVMKIPSIPVVTGPWSLRLMGPRGRSMDMTNQVLGRKGNLIAESAEMSNTMTGHWR